MADARISVRAHATIPFPYREHIRGVKYLEVHQKYSFIMNWNKVSWTRTRACVGPRRRVVLILRPTLVSNHTAKR
jgi:hypothetical protein